MMRLKDEMTFYPDRVNRKIRVYRDNYCALIIATQADVTPEEAFLSLDRDKVFKFRQHKKYTVNDIYMMLNLKDRGLTLEQIAHRYRVDLTTVWKVIEIYGCDRQMDELEVVGMADTKRCKSCKAVILWIMTESGNKMPVNNDEVTVVPDPKGKIFGATLDGKMVRGNLAMKGSEESIAIHVSHFATCPAAEDFRKRRQDTPDGNH